MKGKVDTCSQSNGCALQWCDDGLNRAACQGPSGCGALLARFGQAGHTGSIPLARSAAKPARAMAVIETGALERFGFDQADLAPMCGFHSGKHAGMLAAARSAA